MTTWRRGTRLVLDKTRKTEVPLDTIVRSLEKGSAARVPGTAIFLTSDPAYAPTALLHSLKHYKALHEKVAILTIETDRRADRRRRRRPRAAGAGLAELHRRARGFRLYGEPQRAQGAGHLPQGGAVLRHHVDLVLPVAPASARRG